MIPHRRKPTYRLISGSLHVTALYHDHLPNHNARNTGLRQLQTVDNKRLNTLQAIWNACHRSCILIDTRMPVGIPLPYEIRAEKDTDFRISDPEGEEGASEIGGEGRCHGRGVDPKSYRPLPPAQGDQRFGR